MTNSAIHLGFELGSGNPVDIPCRHMVVTGQTQEAGKTTTLEALIARSGLPAVAFVTKRGEQSFADGRRIEPYFRERADWQFVASVLEATMRERLKFERAWIMRASKGARTLADVHANVRKLMVTAKGLSADVYLTLDAYLEIVVPRIQSVCFAERVDLQPGLNVLDLSDRDRFPAELQSLVMRSVLEWVYEKSHGTITIIPEAWEFIPQGRGSPVKLSAVELVRKGAGLRNYVWLDSQDIGGVDKELLRSCPVWLLGVQREINEVKRTLDNIPAGIAKPTPSEIATLEKGQFFACWGRHVIKTYVQPAWMNPAEAKSISMGGKQISIPNIQKPIITITPTVEHKEHHVTTQEADELRSENQRLREQIRDLQATATEVKSPTPASALIASDQLYQAILARLLKEPAIINLRLAKPEMNVTVQRHTVEADGTTALGWTARLISEGFLNNPTKAYAVWTEAKRRGFSGANPRMNEACDKLTAMGFLTHETDGSYKAVHEMKINIRKP